jgi:ABC-type branched-subunit amino acid transport system substrate-binding protein
MKGTKRLGAALLAVGLIAAACGDDGGSEESTTTTAATTGATGSGPATGATGSGTGVFAKDPRGGIYEAFQKTFDRSKDPFSGLDDFCKPHTAAASRKSTDAMGADTITIVNLRTKLEQLEQIGFALPLGNNNEMYRVFTEYINEKCGGIRGRKISYQMVEVNAQSPTLDADRRAACIKITEDLKAPIALNNSGFAGTGLECLTVEHDTIFITSTSGTTQTTKDSKGRMASIAPTLSEYTKFLGDDLVKQGTLKDKRIAVVYPDTPGYPEAIKEGLIASLKKAGLNIVQEDMIGCKGGSVCADGLPASVDKLISNKIDVLFPALNVVSLPAYVKEMATKGIKPGQVQMYQSNYNSQAGDLVSSKVVDFGGAEAAALYNGTIAVDPTPTGDYRRPGFQQSEFNKLCEKIYNENNKVGEKFTQTEETQNSQAGSVTSACQFVRLAARIVYLAGENPTKADLLKAKENIGAVDSNGQEPATFTPGKVSGWDVLYTLKWNSPCPGTKTPDKVKSCYIPTSDGRSITR